MRAALLLALLLQASGALAQATGSTAFCLFPVPADGGVQRWINLGIVQYVEARNDDVRIYYGGGNLGSGHEARIPVKSREEAEAVLARLRRSAALCAQPVSGGSP
ncbi:hypothetical protein [Zoogloea sp.]|jgi:hypothetical protein|uniref:hypothetical protein n=1 Tax=Zoogloea sp. TaxID=49181 RepID=UPI0025DA9910|nr:hypothetical protein [Zoogloea sp.]MCK6393223.1 hypothetical protein [Zoogloea sp.]